VDKISSLSPSKLYSEARISTILSKMDMNLLSQQRRWESKAIVAKGEFLAVVPASKGYAVH
jgi:hypothetical protein